MYARSTTIFAPPESIDAGVAHVRDEAMPTLLGMDGCIGLSMLVDRASGFALFSVTYDSLEAKRSREKADAEAGAREAGVDIVEVCEFELALAHLRVPEMA